MKKNADINPGYVMLTCHEKSWNYDNVSVVRKKSKLKGLHKKSIVYNPKYSMYS